ncbi:unnamed protein product [Rangifer tarandus platyrhynchus]|uniref:Uncharacterized protein n=1 Tax=Rangifer tarandus platyrhynchus TaxID=3082113 RepID=A0AC59ZCJ7_RANTA
MEVSERGESGTPFHSDKSEPCSRGLLSDLRHSKARTRPRSAASRQNAASPARGVEKLLDAGPKRTKNLRGID